MPKFRERLRIDKLASAASAAIDVLVNGDTEPRVKIDAGGKITWGAGSSSGDTTLYRDSADTLKTDDKFIAGKELVSALSSGDEGGEIQLAIPQTNTTISSGVAIDVYQNKLRIYETGWSNRGAYIDLSSASTGVASDLLAGGGGASALDDLTDVTITSATNGQVLKYNGTAWVNGTDNAGTSINYLDDVGDVTITSAASGDLLQWNGTAWVNESAPTYIQFDSSVGSPSSTEGKLQWDSDFGTLSFGLEGNNAVQQIGINQFAYCYNAEATTLTKGEAVYIFGGQGSQVSIKRASNSAESTSSKTLGLVAESITAGGSGYVCTYGAFQGIDTTAYNEGDILWLGSTGGTLTTTKPTGPNHAVFIGVVIKDAAGGEIWLRPQNGFELDELHNVSAASPSSGDFLKYNGSVWVNDAIDLGTDTTGNYVASLVAGNGITLANNSGEGATPTINAGATVSDSTPSSPTTGQLWYESDTGATFVYTGSAWVEVGATQGPYVCTSTTRPSTPYEGQLIYETDTDLILVYNGSSWRVISASTVTSGTVLQTKITNKTDTFITTNTTFTDVTGYSVTITPKSASSTILVQASMNIGGSYGTNTTYVRLMRDSTAIAVGDSAGSRTQVSIAAEPNTNSMAQGTIQYIDSPATTSSITYKVQICTNGAGSAAINRSIDDTNAAGRPRGFSSIMVMEIAG